MTLGPGVAVYAAYEIARGVTEGGAPDGESGEERAGDDRYAASS